jgi:hypothetical protein
MDARYLKAVSVLPDQDKVCGRTLKAFCLRHRVILEAIDSPFINMNKGFQITPLDVVMAVRILSTYDKSQMVGPLTFWENYELHRMKMSKKRLSKNAGKILGVMLECLSYPKLWSKHDKNTPKAVKGENIPWTLTCVANNVRNGCSLEEAWTMPEGEAVWMSISHALYNGAKINIVSTDDEEMLNEFDNIINRFKESRKN